jgi:DNA-binding GntR family transcriptional regulator
MVARNSAKASVPVAAFETEDHPSLSLMIHDRMRAAILSGALLPGQVLRQEELAAHFRTSRVPLREALQSLQAEGLVVLRPRRGYAVNLIEPRGLHELMRLRVLIESYGGYAGTCARTRDDVAALAGILADFEKLPARLTRESQRARWWSLDHAFHRTLFCAGGNTELAMVFDNVAAKLEPYLLHAAELLEGRQEAMQDHQRLYALFAEGDSASAAVLSRRHCEALGSRFAGLLQRKGGFGDATMPDVTDLGPAAARRRNGIKG